jgi:hypothetical protein
VNAPDPQQLTAMQQLAAMQQQLAALAAENQQLRAELQAVHQRQAAMGKVVRGGAGLLLPLLDRNKVVRSFGQLAQTTASLAGPREQWPTRERFLDDARTFAESCVRFAVRRRMVVLLFSLLATAVPAIQIWLVVQQNQIIENQNEFFEIQVYDIVSRSMTSDDRNANLMAGALLSRADLGFLRGVVEEAFDPDLGGVFRSDGLEAQQLRLDDAAFRGHLARAVVRGVEHRVADVDADELYAQAQPMLHRIVDDARSRVPAVLRIGAGQTGDAALEAELAEQVDGYLVQVGAALRIYWRLAHAAGEDETFFADLGRYLRRVDDVKVGDNRFRDGFRYGLEAIVLELAVAPALDDPPVDLAEAGMDVEAAHQKGLEAMAAGVGDDDIDWAALGAQVGS